MVREVVFAAEWEFMLEWREDKEEISAGGGRLILIAGKSILFYRSRRSAVACKPLVYSSGIARILQPNNKCGCCGQMPMAIITIEWYKSGWDAMGSAIITSDTF